MCDELTEADNLAYLAASQLSRREAAIGAGATLAVMFTGCTTSSAPVQEPQPKTASAEPTTTQTAAKPLGRMVSIQTSDGSAEGFFAAPEGGPHPGVLMWPDVAGLRDVYESMARRLAAEGYAVLVVNQYYRSSKLPVLGSFAEWRTEEGKNKIQPMKQALTAQRVSDDGAAFVSWLDQQPEVDKSRKIGTSGYCMGGPFTFRTAAAASARVGVIASFHGGGLVTDEATSPHTLLIKMQAAALICIAQNDDERDPTAKTTLKQTAEQAGVVAEIQVYPAQHGWCVTDSPVYDQPLAEKAWARMLATFEQSL